MDIHPDYHAIRMCCMVYYKPNGEIITSKIIEIYTKVKFMRKKRNNIEEICAFVVYYVYIRELKKTFDKINCR